jgi:hypothetical protein
LISNKLKCHIFCFIFSSKKSDNRRAEQVLPGAGRGGGGRGESWHQWEGEVARKVGRRVNTVQKMCTYVFKCKNDTCCKYPMNQGRGRDKGVWWRG